MQRDGNSSWRSRRASLSSQSVKGNPVWPLALFLCLSTLPLPSVSGEEWKFPRFRELSSAYAARVPQDDFSKARADLQAGKLPLNTLSEKAFLTSLLKVLNISPSSQMLVFSTTSLQLSRISPSNPRALYFNENVYLGWVPGGQIEVLGIDPEWGAMTYIFDVPRPNSPPPVIRRATRCMNCHAAPEVGNAPGLLVSSVVPGPGGGSLDSFREGITGHSIPLSERFGGWHLTGAPSLKKHWGNLTGEFQAGELKTIPNEPGQRFPLSRYPVESSDVLAHLLHEHQAGFVNRFISATYRTRAALAGKVPGLETGDVPAFLRREARELTRYLLFAEEAALPPGGLSGAPALKTHFLQGAKRDSSGASLREFDLKNRLFKYRCSYMIHSAAFSGLPAPLKTEVLRQLRRALNGDDQGGDYSHLPEVERRVIRAILGETLRDWRESPKTEGG